MSGQNGRPVALVVSSMRAGGAERVLAGMANYWVSRGRVVYVVSFADPEERPFYRLEPGVGYSALNLLGASAGPVSGLYRNLKRVARLRRELKRIQPAVVISFMTETSALTLFAAMETGLPVLVSEHTDPFANPIGPVWRLLSKLAYRRARFIVVLSSHAAGYFNDAANVRVIPNPVQPCNDEDQSTESVSRGKTILAVGRLGPEKCYDLLIEAFAALGRRLADWRLVILGEGPERLSLERLAAERGVEERLDLPGTVADPRPYMRMAGMFVLCSRIEGFPMSLCEAMACGMPVVATAYNDGVHDLIEDGDNGLIVPKNDMNALAGAIERLAKDAELRSRLGKRAVAVADRFSPDWIMSRWDELIEDCASGF